jgi:hypothetical protein
MTEAEGTFVDCEQFLEFLKTQPWCKQGDNVLVAVTKATPEIIDMLRDNELKVFPGNMHVKMQKSTLHNFVTANEDGSPLPVVLAWKPTGVEIWYRRQNPTDFPYDAWTNQAMQILERDRVLVPADKFNADYAKIHADIVAKVKQCPAMIPPH